MHFFLKFPIYISQRCEPAVAVTSTQTPGHLLLLNAVLRIAFLLATMQVQEQIFHSEDSEG